MSRSGTSRAGFPRSASTSNRIVVARSVPAPMPRFGASNACGDCPRTASWVPRRGAPSWTPDTTSAIGCYTVASR